MNLRSARRTCQRCRSPEVACFSPGRRPGWLPRPPPSPPASAAELGRNPSGLLCRELRGEPGKTTLGEILMSSLLTLITCWCSASPAGVAAAAGSRALWPLLSSLAASRCPPATTHTQRHICSFTLKKDLQACVDKTKLNLERQSWGVVQSRCWGVPQEPQETLVHLKTEIRRYEKDESVCNEETS